MPRCTSTNQFASYDEPEAEIQSEDVSGDQYVAEVHVARNCAECGEEMASYDFTLEADLECPACGTDCGGHYGTERDLPLGVLPSDKLPEGHEGYDTANEIEFSLESSEAPTVDESGGGRYKKNIFTVCIEATILCECCGETFEVNPSDSAAASEFEVLV